MADTAHPDHFPDAGEMIGEADEIKRLRADCFAALALVADIRLAVGDAGLRMQDELVAYIRGIVSERDALRERIESAPLLTATRNGVIRTGVGAFPPGAKVRLVVEDAV